MKKTKKREKQKLPLVWVSWLLLTLFIALEVYLFFFKTYLTQDYWEYRNDHPQPLSAGVGALEQEFISPGPLARLDVLLANYRKKPGSGSLHLALFRSGALVFEDHYPADSVEDNQFYSFAIPPRSGLSEGYYRLKLSYKEAGTGDRLAAWIFRQDIYPFGALFIDGQAQKADLTFRVYYRSTLAGGFGNMMRQIPDMAGFRVLILISMTVMIVMLNFFMLYLFRRLIAEEAYPGKTPAETAGSGGYT